VELTDLKIFVKIAEEGNISRAAEGLGYVQSNVTARIKKLEAELGVLLFNRQPHGVTLTEKGALFREYAYPIIRLSEEAVHAMEDAPHPSGSLSIGVVDTVHCGSFIRALSDYQAKYPNVSLSFITGSSPDLIAKLLNYQLDGAFVTGEIPSAKLVTEYSEQDEIRLLTTWNGPSLPDLSGTKWVVSPIGCPFRQALETWLRSENIPLTNMIEVSSLDTLLSIVRSGLASTLLPSSVLSEEYAELNSYQVPKAFRHTATSLVRRNDRFGSKAFSAFVELVKVNFARETGL